MPQQSRKKQLDYIWGEYEIQLDQHRTWKIGALRLWCKQIKDEIQVAYLHEVDDSEKSAAMSEPPSEITWSRWAMRQEQSKIRLSPVFPDLPVVVKPESSFRLMKSAQARIYVRVPIWIQIDLATSTPVKLIEIPSVILSNTWFGTFFEGELCYWISTSAKRQVEPDPDRPYLAICPIQLINKAEEDLLVEKICLRVRNLSLFYKDLQLWSDETRMVYKGVGETSQIEANGTPPAVAKSAPLLTVPREPQKKSFAAKTFASLKELSGIGIVTN